MTSRGWRKILTAAMETAPKRPENPSGRNYADELSPLTDASIRDNATMLLKELKTKDAGR